MSSPGQPSSPGQIAVTGATGFVGHNLVERFAGLGWRIVCLVRAGSNTAHLHRFGVTVRHLELGDEAALEEALAGAQVLLHAANDPIAPASMPIGSIGRAAERAGVEHLVFFSTAAVHDIHAGDHAITVDGPTRPASDYSRAKLAAERALAERRPGSAPAVTVLRPTNVYGPWDLKGVLFRWFQAARDGDLTLLGTGGNRIHLCHVANLVELTVRVAREPAAFGRTYFAADRRAETLGDILTAVCETWGRKLERLPLPAASMPFTRRVLGRLNRGRRPYRLPPKLAAHLHHDYQVDVGPAERDLGWSPAVGLAAGTRATAAWYRSFGVL